MLFFFSTEFIPNSILNFEDENLILRMGGMNIYILTLINYFNHSSYRKSKIQTNIINRISKE